MPIVARLRVTCDDDGKEIVDITGTNEAKYNLNDLMYDAKGHLDHGALILTATYKEVEYK